MSNELLLVAASGLAREVAESARRAGWDPLGCLDDNPGLRGSEVMAGLPVLGPLEAIAEFPDASLLLCAGKGTVRQRMAGLLGQLGVAPKRYAVLVDPSVTVPPSCTVGAGSILLAGTVLTASVTLGRHVVCMPQVVLTHDDVIEDFVTFGAGVLLGGRVSVGTGAYVGMGATVRQNVRIGVSGTLGMGATLLRDLPQGEVWAGVPAEQLGGRAA